VFSPNCVKTIYNGIGYSIAIMHRVKIRKPLWQRVEDYAEEEELSVFEIVDRAITNYLEKYADEGDDDDDDDDDEKEEEEELF